MVDEQVAVALACADRGVAVLLPEGDRVGEVPGQKQGAPAGAKLVEQVGVAQREAEHGSGGCPLAVGGFEAADLPLAAIVADDRHEAGGLSDTQGLRPLPSQHSPTPTGQGPAAIPLDH
jgi:hypothetical protein